MELLVLAGSITIFLMLNKLLQYERFSNAQSVLLRIDPNLVKEFN